MNRALEQLVRSRADGVCEYCRVPEDLDPLPFCIDHIIAQKHRGPTAESNLALACYNCNSYKGPNISGIDPDTRQLSRLFHPRRDSWETHFEWDGARLVGRTAVGRATSDVLNINDRNRLEHRRLLIRDGRLPRGS